jgi:hypothetical protein
VPEAAELLTVHCSIIFPFWALDATWKKDKGAAATTLPPAEVKVSGNVNEALSFSTVCARSKLVAQQRMQPSRAIFLVTMTPPLIVLVNRLMSDFVFFFSIFHFISVT